ncbi:MAG TPA: hypothetical protein VK502_01500 [Candidatus Saccharimonadales bacterium]|nr:hypothetical protein [Candidatus Saccharimonadales bacterium]
MKIDKLRLLVPPNTSPKLIEEHIKHIHLIHKPKQEGVAPAKKVYVVRWERGDTLGRHIKTRIRLYADPSVEGLLTSEDQEAWRLNWSRVATRYSSAAPPLFYLADEITERPR